MFGKKKQEMPKIRDIKCPYCEKNLESVIDYSVEGTENDGAILVGCPNCKNCLAH